MITGCTDPGSSCAWNGIGGGETLDRVCGLASGPDMKMLVQPGNVWPPAPVLVPTMLDLQHGPKIVATDAALARAAKQHRRGNGLCEAGKRPPASEGTAPPIGVALGLCYTPRK